MLDLDRLRRGTIIALASAGISLVVAIGHNILLYPREGDAETGVNVLMTEGILFGAGVLVGLLIATYVSVRHSRARPIPQGLAAIPLNWAAAFLPAAIAAGLFFGDVGGTVQISLIAAPVYVIGQVLAAFAGGLINRWRPREPDFD